MQKILYKTSVSEGAKCLASFFDSMGTILEVTDFNNADEVVGDYVACILTINFEDEEELNRAKKFIRLNKHINFYAYVNEGSRNAIINAHHLGCTKFFAKFEDLKETFTPFVQNNISIQWQSKSDGMYQEFKGLKVLVVDDVEVNLKLLTEILAPFCFEVHPYTDSALASEAIERIKYDLILTDAIMPKLDGFGLARIAKNAELNQNTPIVFVSGYCQAENKIECYNLGSVAFIEKPLDPAMVRAQISSILKIRNLQMEIVNQKENFVAMLTHDLKTPIRAQISALNLLLENNLGELQGPVREIINEIMASNRYMQTMTDNVLLKYKSENGELCIQKSRNNIKTTIESAVRKLKYVIMQKNQTLKVSYNTENDWAYYDGIEIERVLTNLVVNAAEYSPENSQINVSVENNEDKITVSVEDSGCGIDDDELKVFIEKKYASRAKEYKKIGTGLGLYICNKIISGHGGKISVERLPEKGSRFTFTISNKGESKQARIAQ